MVNFGPVARVSEKFKDLKFYQHNPTLTLMRTTVDGIPISVIEREVLLRNKLSTGRMKDRADAEWLETHPTSDTR